MKTLLGPRSLDKLIVEEDGHVLITNDGATAISALVSSLSFIGLCYCSNCSIQ
jgi:chaperonin GroEL (HSP60 family)